MEALKHLNKYFWKYRYRFVLGLLFVFVSNVFGLYPPIYIGEVLNLISDSLSQNKNLDATSQTILEKQLAITHF